MTGGGRSDIRCGDALFPAGVMFLGSLFLRGQLTGGRGGRVVSLGSIKIEEMFLFSFRGIDVLVETRRKNGKIIVVDEVSRVPRGRG